MIENKDALFQLLGKDNLLDDSTSLQAFARDESFVHPLKPWFIARPQNVSQIQSLIAWANRSRTPLVPVSSGPPHFRGDTVPAVPGAVMVDLSGMTRVIHVDTRNRMVIVEPGITYARLQPELAKFGLKLSSPLAPRANKSVIASLLEREPIIIPRYQWNMLDPLRCLEVVWGDGQKMTTGEAGGGGTLEEEWARNYAQVTPSGPAQLDFYRLTSAAQGSMGIVSWASLKCEILPRIHNLFLITSSNLEALLEATYAILRIRFGDELFILNNTLLASLLEREPASIQALASQLPGWSLLVGIAGRDRLPEERVAYQEKDLAELAQRYGLELLPAVPGANGTEVLKIILNPSSDPYWKTALRGSCQEIFFLNTLDHAPDFIQTMYSAAQVFGYPTPDIGVYIQPVHQGASCHIEFDLPFNRASPRELERMQQVYTRASEELFKRGAYYSRPYGLWASLAFNRDAQTTAALKKIKGIFDPNNILNPGKLCF